MKKLIAYLELARPLNGMIAFISAWLGGLFASQGNMGNLINIRLLLVSISALVLLSAGNAINDYCDYDIDRINRPRRPLPSGRIRRTSALIFAIVLTAIGIYLGTLINRNATVIAILVCVALVCYAFYLKRTPFVGKLSRQRTNRSNLHRWRRSDRLGARYTRSSNLCLSVHNGAGNRQRP